MVIKKTITHGDCEEQVITRSWNHSVDQITQSRYPLQQEWVYVFKAGSLSINLFSGFLSFSIWKAS
jgi:hypothetical protein